jgi:transcriptional regulator with XRE-family HTH domain
MTTFGARLRKARLARGVTQEELGLDLDVTKATVSSWESDRIVPQFQKLEALRNALGVDLDYLICNSVAAARTASQGLGVREAEPGGYAGGVQQSISPREVNLLTAWRAMSPEQQNALLVMMRPSRSGTVARRALKART